MRLKSEGKEEEGFVLGRNLHFHCQGRLSSPRLGWVCWAGLGGIFREVGSGRGGTGSKRFDEDLVKVFQTLQLPKKVLFLEGLNFFTNWGKVQLHLLASL